MSVEEVLVKLGLAERRPLGVEAQVHALSAEVRRVSRDLSQLALDRADDWRHDLADRSWRAARQGTDLASAAGLRVSQSAKAFRRDPIPAIAVLGTALLMVSLLRR